MKEIPQKTDLNKCAPLRTDALSMTELGIYLSWKMEPSKRVYNIPFFLPLPYGTDINRLCMALKKTVAAHRGLMARFRMTENGEVIRIIPEGDIDEDMVRVSIRNDEPEFNDLVRPFDDTEDELYRLVILKGDERDWLFMDIHHLIFDGTSMRIFISELNRAYEGKELIGENFTVKDIAVREQKLRDSRAFEDAREWYTSLLGDGEYNTALIHDKDGAAEKCAYLEHKLITDGSGIHEYAGLLGIRVSTFFTGVYGYLLSRFAGSQNALYATVHSSRDSINSNTIGMLVKTHPVLEDFSENKSIKEHLKELDEQITKSRNTGIFSYVDINSVLAPNIPTLFAYQGEMFKEIDFLTGSVVMDAIPTGDPKQDMVTEVIRDRGSYILRIEYRRDLYEHSSIAQFAYSYEKTINEFLIKDSFADVDITADVQLKTLDSFVNEDVPVNEDCNMVSLFRKAAKDHPDNTAIIIGDIKRTYKYIDELTERISRHLINRQIGTGSVVAVLIDRNEYMVSASLGVLKSGAAYLPLDPSYPAERLNFMVSDAGAGFLIADRALAQVLNDFEDRVLYTDDIPSLPAFNGSEYGEYSHHVPDGEDLFTLLYTSGSTGTPKGVMIKHGNIANFCVHYASDMNIDAGTVCSAYASYGFDANMMDMYPGLTKGACICVVPSDIRMDLRALGAYFDKNNVNIAFMTTQVGRQFAQSQYRPHCLKKLLVGGERLAGISVPEGVELINLYGPTECTVFVTSKKVDREYLRIPVGRSFAGAALYVVDEYGHRVPPCVPGELTVAGPCVAKGYLNRPEKDAESFIVNRFCDKKGYERMYRTGDIVRFLPDGEVDYIGRNDGQVKIRGFRIELSEVESVIREHPDIEDAAVKAFDNDNGSGKYLVAYIVKKKGGSVGRSELEAFIRKQKPPYMVPSAIVEIEKIPLNQNQKVDLKQLKKPQLTDPGEEKKAARDLTDLEKDILNIVSEVLGNTMTGISVPLTDVGLTSISAMQFISELDEKLGLSPDAGELLKGMSVLDIENFVVGYLRDRCRLADGVNMDAAAMVKEAVKIVRAPLTQTQLGIYLECRMDERSDKYNIPLLFRLNKDIDTDRLMDAIHKAVEAHPFIKCRIEPTEDGSADMIAEPELKWTVKTEELNLSDDEIEKRFMAEPVIFKLSRAPLFDIRIIRSENSLYLFMVFHHIIMDGTSVSVLMEDIESAYQGRVLKIETYNSFVLALDEKKKRETDSLKEAKEVYDRIFTGVSVDSLVRSEKTSDKNEKGRAATASYMLDGVNEEEISVFCRENNVTENAIFTAAFAYMLSRINADEEVMFACVHNGRLSSETFRIMGMLVKTYPFYFNIDKAQKCADYVKAVSSRIRELTVNELYSFAEAVRDHNVSADVMFAYQGDSFNGYTVGGKEAVLIDMPLKDAKEPLSVDLSKLNGKYRIVFEYRDDMYVPEQIKWMSRLYISIVKGLVSGGFLDGIELLDREGSDFLKRINDTSVEIPFVPVRCLLERNASKYPDRTAVIFGDAAVTYRELNEAANRIAHGLVKLNVSGKITALMLERSEKVYMVRQGILKAGSAFLSIDPEYPDERIRMMLDDSETSVLIVSEEILNERMDLFDSLNCHTVTVEELLENENTANPDIDAEKDDPAYCIFTSGSTGRPKGVILTQGNLINFLDENDRNPEILGYTQRASNSLALAAITFDVSIMEEFIPLSHGMTVCMASKEQIHDPAALADFMIKNSVDMVTATPSFLLSCIGLDVMKKALKNVKAYDLGAEAFPAPLYDKITEINPKAYIMNGYGPTEATISCTMEHITGTELITIGRPASNVKAYIIDEKGNVLPPLVPGELVIAGEGVGKGYIARPELTAEKFITFEGFRAYRTGDVAAWTSDGRLRFKGRSDDQVKLRGLRVELGEIESAINSVDGVNSSVVVMRGEESNAFLAGFYTASRNITGDEIKSIISGTLTPYMIPGVLMRLDDLPLTANGKVDKRKLPEVTFTPDETNFREPSNDAERDFCHWFAEVLKLDRVSAEGDFFELGGTSLSASVIAMHAKNKGYNVVYADIFKTRTPAALAKLALGNAPMVSSAKENNEIKEYDYDRLDLSHNQDSYLKSIDMGDIGNIMITGALGFLGIHVLREYLLEYEGTAYCMVRGENGERRLKSIYYYYFSEMPDEYIKSGRLRMTIGDITDEEALKRAEPLPFDTLINCAAIVKHFVKDDSLLKTNVGGVKNLIRLCKKKGARLIQTSTVSVAGEGLDGIPAPDRLLYEKELYMGQLIDNAYIHSKFLAERAVLEAVREGLSGKIMRLGNLMGRSADGEFQINFRTNAFIRSLASYKKLEAVPYSLLNAQTDFSEIDMTARSILKLAGTGDEFTVFHAMNNHSVTYADIVYAMREYGMRVEAVEDDEFENIMENSDAAGALIAYSTREGNERRYMLGADCSFTTNALYRLGFKWPVTNEDYIVKMLEALGGMSMMR